MMFSPQGDIDRERLANDTSSQTGDMLRSWHRGRIWRARAYTARMAYLDSDRAAGWARPILDAQVLEHDAHMEGYRATEAPNE